MTSNPPSRIYLSPPHMTGEEMTLIQEAFDTNWVAPLGPHVDAFEQEFARAIRAKYTLALNSGTAALHLALREIGVGPGDEVFVSDLTFCASVNPILYVGATPVFVDSETDSWNMDPELLAEALADRIQNGRLPKAVVLVHLYGQSANIDPILGECQKYGIPLIEDAAEALGATYRERAPGTFGKAGIFSFNGNKILTTSGGGMLVSADGDLISHARKLATQARDPAPHYQHSEIGYNYRLSNVLAAIGRAQLAALASRVAARRRNFAYYALALGDLPGIAFQPEASWGKHSRWLTVMTVDATKFGADRDAIRIALERENIEARPVWKPMHCQPAYEQYTHIGGRVAEQLFRDGLCLPSGSALTTQELGRICHIIKQTCPNA